MAVDGPNGISSQRIHGGDVRPERTEQTATPRTSTAQPATVPEGDVLQRGSEARAPTAGTTDLERRIAELEAREQQRIDADRVQKEKEAEEAKEKGWFKRGLFEIFEIFARIVFPPLNLISFYVRAARIAMKWLKGENIDWKKEGLRALGDLVGGLVPGLSWVGAAANTGVNLLWEEDRSQILGREYQQESGLKTAGRKAYSLGKDIVEGVQHKLTGNDPAAEERIRETGIDHRPVRPAEVPVS